jgi:cobalt-zinc-cadmium efflux system protein
LTNPDTATKHTHSHAHAHGEEIQNLGAKLGFSILLNIAIVVAQLIGGILSGSLALLSDAAHNLSDVVGLLLSYSAHRLEKLPATARRTYAFQRAEVLAAFLNAAGLVAVSGWVIFEGIQRLQHPTPVAGATVMLLALVGLVGNALSALLLRGGHSLNIKTAFLHLFGDAIASLGVLLGGAILYFTGFSAIDSIVSILLSLWMLRESVGIIRTSVDLLMQSVPADIDVAAVTALILAQEHFTEVHDLHLWGLSSTSSVLSAHLRTDCADAVVINGTLRELKNLIREEFGITHITLEVESGDCECSGGIC